MDGRTLPPADKLMVEGIAEQIDARVERAAAAVLSDPGAVPVIDGHTRNWVNSYNEWIDPATTPERRAAIEGLFPRQFGYAVETMANGLIRDEVGPTLDDDITISTQVTHGATRPDLVVIRTDPVSGLKQELAWIDITADASVGHIHNKQSSLWDTRPYVAETLYPSLDRTQLGSNSSPEARQMAEAIAAAHARQQEATAQQLSSMRDRLPAPLDSFNKANRAKDIEVKLGEMFNDNHKLTPTEARNVLAALKDKYGNDYAPSQYGYSTGGSAVEGRRLIEWFLARENAAAQPDEAMDLT